MLTSRVMHTPSRAPGGIGYRQVDDFCGSGRDVVSGRIAAADIENLPDIVNGGGRVISGPMGPRTPGALQRRPVAGTVRVQLKALGERAGHEGPAIGSGVNPGIKLHTVEIDQ